jgi:hypothetical protein
LGENNHEFASIAAQSALDRLHRLWNSDVKGSRSQVQNADGTDERRYEAAGDRHP